MLEIQAGMDVGLHGKCLLFLYDFNQRWICLQVLVKHIIIKLKKTHWVFCDLFHATAR
jgi:hypothetical protein